MDDSAIIGREDGKAPQPARVTVVESEACHFCTDARRVLAGFAVDHQLAVQFVDAGSEAGRLLMAQHRAAMSPLVLIDGEFFSNGRLPRRKLARHLAERHGVPSAARRVGSGGPHG